MTEQVLLAANFFTDVGASLLANADDLVINVVLLGALYSLIAIGFTLIFGVGGVLNLAHGALITLGAYSALWVVQMDVSIWLAAVAAIVVPGLFAVALYKGMIRFVEDEPVIVLILTILVSIVIEELLIETQSGQIISLGRFVSGQVTIPVLGESVQANELFALVVSIVLLAAVFLFVNHTKQGKAILATSMSHKGASLVGIQSERVYTYTWLLGGALAGIAGVFLAAKSGGGPHMGREPLLLAFAIVVLGGLGSIKGSVIGAYLVSFVDQVMIFGISPRLSGLAGLVILVVVLLVKPEGLFGREFAE